MTRPRPAQQRPRRRQDAAPPPPASSPEPAPKPAAAPADAAVREAGAPRYTLRTVERIADVPAAAWDACANPGGAPANPFIAHAFLRALEESGSVEPRTGWLPCHAVLEEGGGSGSGGEEEGGRVAAVAPLYVKGHSQGEYVFDHGWAQAFEDAGGRYYPKLLGAVPFTPATGRRLLVRPPDGGAEAAQEEASAAETHLVAGCIEIARRFEVSSLHFNFLEAREWERLGALGFLRRTDQQFHWRNEGYASFDDFLGRLGSKKRKNLKRERRIALENGIEVEWVTGAALGEAHWDAFYRFYVDTGSRKWGRPYLSRRFFSLAGEAMADRILLVMCRRAGRYVAGALNFIGGDTLYGRNWGCIEDHPMLHFEACYYQAIDFAIAHGLAFVEAGAQGPHKVARGYLPRRTHSAHWIAHEGLRSAVARYLEGERRHVDEAMEAIAGHSPFRRAGPGPGPGPGPGA